MRAAQGSFVGGGVAFGPSAQGEVLTQISELPSPFRAQPAGDQPGQMNQNGRQCVFCPAPNKRSAN